MNRRERALQDYCDCVYSALVNGPDLETVASMRKALLKISKRHWKELWRNEGFRALFHAISDGVDDWELNEGYTDELPVSPQIEALKKTVGVRQ